MLRTSVMCGAMALAVLLGSGSVRAEEKKSEAKAPPAVGQMRIGITRDADNDKELTHGWYGHHYYYRYHSYYHYRPYYYNYYHYRPYYYSYTPVYYYPPTYYYYYCNGGSIGSQAKDAEPRTSVERAKVKMKVSPTLFNSK